MIKVSNRLIALLGLVVVGVLPACGAAPQGDASQEEVGATSQALSSTSAWGFVWAQNATGTYTAHPTYSRNSSGNASGIGVNNTVTQTGTGTYRVDFPNIGNEFGGNVQVTAYGGSSERCKVASWGPASTTLQVQVNCFDSAGRPVNTRFTVSYARRASSCCDSSGGYLWADQPSAPSYTPDSTYQWNSTGVNNTITRNGVGSYTANFPGLNVPGGTVEVTAYGWDSAQCKAVSWGSSSVNVACFANNGTPIDSRFTLNFSNQISPNEGPSFAYAWADQQSAASYTPFSTYQFGALHSECTQFQGPITVQRSSVGQYSVFIPTLSPTGSNVKVTAYGSGSESCKVMGWSGSGSGTVASVACFNAAGTAVDTRYVIVYTTDQFIIC